MFNTLFQGTAGAHWERIWKRGAAAAENPKACGGCEAAGSGERGAGRHPAQGAVQRERAAGGGGTQSQSPTGWD